MSITGVSGGMPRVSSGASSRVANVRQAQPQGGGASQGVAAAQALKNSLSALEAVGKNTGATGKAGKISIYA